MDRSVPSWTSSPAPRSPKTWENLHSSGSWGDGAEASAGSCAAAPFIASGRWIGCVGGLAWAGSVATRGEGGMELRGGCGDSGEGLGFHGGRNGE